MYACQWHFDIPFGKQKEVIEIMQQWEKEIQADPAAPNGLGRRLMVGHVGASASHIIHEHLVQELDDWDKTLKVVATGKFQKYSDMIAPYIVAGSQHWIIYRVAAQS